MQRPETEKSPRNVDAILCVLVAYNNGERVWEPLADYSRNPSPGSFIIRDERINTFR